MAAAHSLIGGDGERVRRGKRLVRRTAGAFAGSSPATAATLVRDGSAALPRNVEPQQSMAAVARLSPYRRPAFVVAHGERTTTFLTTAPAQRADRPIRRTDRGASRASAAIGAHACRGARRVTANTANPYAASRRPTDRAGTLHRIADPGCRRLSAPGTPGAPSSLCCVRRACHTCLSTPTT